MNTPPDDVEKHRNMYFRLRYITRDFSFGGTQIEIDDPERKIKFSLRQRVQGDGDFPPLERGDGIVSVICERKVKERLYDEAVSSGQLSFKKGTVSSVATEITTFLSLVMRLIRWRTNSEGAPNPIRTGFGEGLVWSVDGIEWRSVVDWISLRIDQAHVPVWDDPAKQFIVESVSKQVDEPLGHELLREAWAHRTAHPRSSVVLAVTAAEVGFKQFAIAKFPETSWLLENLQSPPLVRMLRDLFPWSALKLQINGKEARPPASIADTLEKAVNLRNDIVHKGRKDLNMDTIDSVLAAVRDLLYFLDGLTGQNWALNYLSADARGTFVKR